MNKRLFFALMIVLPCITLPTFAQNIVLNVIGESGVATTEIESIGYTKQFPNYLSLETEVYALKDKLIRIGFIDTKINEIRSLDE